MNRNLLFGVLVGLTILLVACTPSPATEPEPAVQDPPVQPASLVQPSEPPPATAPPTEAPLTPTIALPIPTLTAGPTSEPSPFPLAEHGPYLTGNRKVKVVDESRGGREIEVVLFYPATENLNANGRHVPRDAAPDLSAAPYPLILTEADTGMSILQDYLASHGFVMAQILIPDHMEYEVWDINAITWPRDFLSVLNQLAASPPDGLEGVIDTDNVGATGYSYGGDIALALGGVRVDPAAYLAYCAQPTTQSSSLGDAEWFDKYLCSLADKWDEFETVAGEAVTTTEDGLWQPVTDERIRAVMPMAPGGAWLYNERGLGAANRPMMLVVSQHDEFTPIDQEFSYLYNWLGAPEKALVTFLNRGHMMVMYDWPSKAMRHFVTAFFGKHLQGKQDYDQYLNEDFVKQFEELYYGLYPGDD